MEMVSCDTLLSSSFYQPSIFGLESNVHRHNTMDVDKDTHDQLIHPPSLVKDYFEDISRKCSLVLGALCLMSLCLGRACIVCVWEL